MFDLFGSLATTTFSRPDGTKLALLTAVPEDPRGTVLFVHGFTGAKEDFLFVLPELEAAGWAGYAMDLRGNHQSVSPGPFDLDVLADDVVALAQHLGGHVHLVAHSFGGLSAQRAVISSASTFASLTLVCSGPAGLTAEPDLVPVTIDRVTMFRTELEGKSLSEAWDAKTAYENVDMHPAMASFLRDRFVVGDHAAALRNIDDLLGAEDRIDEVAATGLPCYVMFGADDGTWNQRTQNEMARRLGVEPTTIPEATHVPMLENVDATVEALLRGFEDAEGRAG